MTANLTRRQEAICIFIAAYKSVVGYPPTVREIGVGVGLKSTDSMHFQLKQLERKRVLVRPASKARALTFGPNAPDWTSKQGRGVA